MRRALGTSLPGARGETLADQDRIDRTVARGCAIGVFTQAACERHTRVSFARRAELREPLTERTATTIDPALAPGNLYRGM